MARCPAGAAHTEDSGSIGFNGRHTSDGGDTGEKLGESAGRRLEWCVESVYIFVCVCVCVCVCIEKSFGSSRGSAPGICVVNRALSLSLYTYMYMYICI